MLSLPYRTCFLQAFAAGTCAIPTPLPLLRLVIYDVFLPVLGHGCPYTHKVHVTEYDTGTRIL